MTSKEFTRRCEFFKSFDKAASLFLSSVYSLSFYIYRCTLYNGSCVFTSYCLSPDLDVFPASLLDSCSYVLFEKFTFSEFKIQYRYFLSFLSRLSERQLSSLVSSGCFTYLLKFKDEMSK